MGILIVLGLFLLAEEAYQALRRRRRRRREAEWDAADAEALAVLRRMTIDQGEERHEPVQTGSGAQPGVEGA